MHACLIQEGGTILLLPGILKPEQVVVRAMQSQGAQQSGAVSQPGFSLPVTTQPEEMKCGLNRHLGLLGKA